LRAGLVFEVPTLGLSTGILKTRFQPAQCRPFDREPLQGDGVDADQQPKGNSRPWFGGIRIEPIELGRLWYDHRCGPGAGPRSVLGRRRR